MTAATHARNAPASASRWAMVIAVGLSGAAAWGQVARSAEFESFASTVLYLDDDASPANVTCYLSNAGGAAVRVKNFKVFSRTGAVPPLSANTCGTADAFTLAAGAACSIATTQIGPAAQGFGCGALVAYGAALRGEVELRDASARVEASADMTLPPPGSQASGFTPVSSPPMFGASDQISANCIFTNVGTTAARIRKVKFVSSTGQVVRPTNSSTNCATDEGVVTAPPGASCLLSAPVPVQDSQCRGEVSNRPDIRGAMVIVQHGDALPNVLPLE